MGIIVVKWGENDMWVISSDHPRFSTGTRFDYGFCNVAMREGYTVILKS